jgi:Fe-S cluster assembly protein SufD
MMLVQRGEHRTELLSAGAPAELKVTLADDATLELLLLQDASAELKLQAEVGSNAVLKVVAICLPGGSDAVINNDFRVEVNGVGAEVRLSGMVIADGAQCVANTTNVRHHGERTRSNQLFKYIVNDQARCEFNGTIVVDEQARFTEAYQTNRNLVESNQAHMHAEPALEIYCDEVKCSHGAATGQLDEQALFYMRTRGIPEQEARHLLMEAFMADVIAAVDFNEDMHQKVQELVSARFAGGNTK